jgi:acetyl esterase/lipase
MTVAAARAALDPGLFQPDAIDAETSAFNSQLAEVLATIPPVWTRPPAETRALREAGKGPMGPLVLSQMAEERSIVGPGGAIKLRTFVPPTVAGVYLFLHGGGWVLGAAHHNDGPLEALANNANLAVVSVDYRLAPEHPYPAGPDDCEAAAVWLAEHAAAEFGSDRLVIGGESAGGHLSVTTLLRMRDKHGYTGFKAANLVFGVYDLAGTPSSELAADSLVINRQSMHWFGDHFVPAERRREPDVSPIYADVHNMPPALFTVGTLDPLLDDTLFLYARWITAGNQAELEVYPGAVHGFVNFEYPQARQARARITDYVRAAVRADA